jgi:hypothetical protein
MIRFFLTFFLLALAPAVHAAGAPATQPQLAEGWAPLSFLIGDWEGIDSGGRPSGRFSLEPQAGGHALLRRNTADVQGGHHEDVMLIYRAPGQGIRATYVDNENHVIQYSVTATDDPKTAVFLSDETSGTPGAPRFRLTYRMKPDGTVAIVFDIAPPGAKEFKTYLEGSARKK